jgi:hypothetical protein
MKTILIGGIEFSRVMCGTNPFYARSHFSEARDAEYRQRFDDQAIERVVERCLQLGINTVESSANERICRLHQSLRARHESLIHFVGSTRIDDTSQMKSHQQKLQYLIDMRAAICLIHAQMVDRPGNSGGIAGLERMLDKIHEAGLLAGISTHRISTVELCEKRGYAIDTYMFPLNVTGFVYPGYDGRETPQERASLVRGVDKPFILIKVLGAGRIPPQEGLQFVAENCKPNDLVSLGFGSVEELEETVCLFEKCFPERT